MRRDLVVIGASAGGVEALRQLAAALPEELPAAVLVVLHIGSHATSQLGQILDRSGPLPAAEARDGETLGIGTIRVARPDYHLLVTDGQLRLSGGPRENFHRPAIDALFRSAAVAHGGRTIGVLLSGVLDDGVDGLREIERRGGITVVQDPSDALFGQLPTVALEAMRIDHKVTATEAGSLLARLTSEEVGALVGEIAEGEPRGMGLHSGLSCPECGGVLDETETGERVYHRCHVGHAFGPETLLAAQEEDTERALWAASRLLEDRSTLLGRLEGRARARGAEGLAKQYRRRAREATRHAGALKGLAKRPGRDEVERGGSASVDKAAG